jgi:hypothetical protein
LASAASFLDNDDEGVLNAYETLAKFLPPQS